MARLTPWWLGVFALAALLHVLWAVIILFGGENALYATPLYTLGSWIGHRYLVAAVLLIASCCAALSLLWPIWNRWAIGVLIPQQAVLLISGFGSLTSVLNSAYADGVVRPSDFIASDQMLTILVAVIHTFAMLWLSIYGTRHAR